jgi:hypothetical protein
MHTVRLGWAGKVELRGRQAVAAQWGNRRVVNHWSLEHCELIMPSTLRHGAYGFDIAGRKAIELTSHNKT